jgi:uncharacterized RDD family membrane protein YckC
MPAAWWAALSELLIDWIYAALFISSPWRATLGQAVMGLHVTDLDGNRISFVRASVRYLAQLLNLVTLGFGLLLRSSRAPAARHRERHRRRAFAARRPRGRRAGHEAVP